MRVFLLSIHFLLFVTCLFASEDDLQIDSLDKQSRAALRAKKFDDVIHKTILIISYLNYSDRVIDRPLGGTKQYLAYEGLEIRHINIKIFNPYGLSLDEPEKYAANKFQRLANRMQINTLSWVIKNDLQFSEGDTIDALDFSDTEKLLRERDYLKDFKITILPVDSTNTADVLLLARDKWSWNFKSIPNVDRITFGIEFSNFLGLPHSLSQSVAIKFRRDNLYLLEGGYRYSNIKHSKINFDIGYEYSKINHLINAGLNKDFLSADDRWAGCAIFETENSYARMTSAYGPIIPTNTIAVKGDLWYAHAFPVKKKFNVNNNRYYRIIASGRFLRTDFLKRPYKAAPDNSQQFISGMTILGGIGFASWDYYFDRMVYYLGSGEYFSKGNSLSLIAGWQRDEQLKDRLYVSFRFNHGFYNERFGYVFVEMNYSSFSSFKTRSQGLIKIKGSFYSKQIKMRKWFCRQFLSGAFFLGINQSSGRENMVNHFNGLSGVYFDALRGNTNMVLNYEIGFYPTFKVFGLHSNLFAFGDLALLSGGSTFQDQTIRVYPSVGFGLRVRNLEFAWGYIELSLSYTPVLRDYNYKPVVFHYAEENRRAIGRSNLFSKETMAIDF